MKLFLTANRSLTGKRTYLICLLYLAYAILGLCLGQQSFGEFVNVLFEAFAIMFLRAGKS